MIPRILCCHCPDARSCANWRNSSTAEQRVSWGADCPESCMVCVEGRFNVDVKRCQRMWILRNRRVIRDFQESYEDKQFRIDVPKGACHWLYALWHLSIGMGVAVTEALKSPLTLDLCGTVKKSQWNFERSSVIHAFNIFNAASP